MSIRNLDKIFRPKSVAVVGASKTKKSVGFTVLQNIRSSGFDGPLYPVNPKYASVQGIPAYAAVRELADTPDLAVLCTPAATIPGLVRECGEAGIRGLLILSAGFREFGEEGKGLEDRVAEEARTFDGLRIVGPNCLGILVPRAKLNASFAADNPSPGRVAFVSQSGALCTAVLDWAVEEGIGFSHFISVGNMLDVDFGDLIDYLAADPDTDSLILYIESISGARKFLSAARAFTRAKPIVAYKAGRFAESAKAAASHTGAMAGEDAVYDATLSRAGIVRVYESEDMFDCAELLASERTPRRGRLAIVTNAGGPGVMATDTLKQQQGSLASLTPETIGKLDALLPRYWSRGNPVDVLGDASPHRYADALELVLADPEVDAVLAILAPQAMTAADDAAKEVARVAKQSTKTVLSAWMGGAAMREGRRVLTGAGIPSFSTPEEAVRAFLHLVSYARNQEMLYETPRDIPVTITPDRKRIETELHRARSRGEPVLSETVSKQWLEAYGIPVNPTEVAGSAEEAVAAARRLDYPVVLKVYSPSITHKTDVGGVVLNLDSDEAVASAFDRILASAKRSRPDASLRGVTVQPMVSSPFGIEMILGTKKDPTFGPAILVGMGGVAAEVFQDRSLELPPLNERLASRMLESLTSWPLLNGYRGRPPVQLDRLLEVLIRFSYLVADLPQIQSLDINPLLVTPTGVVAVDARVVLDMETLERAIPPYAHLAIRPYPVGLARERRLKDGTPVRLRPIRPEDEPLWNELIDSCSSETLFKRFQGVFRRTHELASRFCFIDYDREMAIVAEVEPEAAPMDAHERARRKLVGVARLVAESDPKSAEYAVLVTDDWQGVGLGGPLDRDLSRDCRDAGNPPSRGPHLDGQRSDEEGFREVRLQHRFGISRSHRREQGALTLQRGTVIRLGSAALGHGPLMRCVDPSVVALRQHVGRVSRECKPLPAVRRRRDGKNSGTQVFSRSS